MLHFIKLENVCASEDFVKTMKRQATDEAKVFANHISNKGLCSESIKKYHKLLIIRQTTQF